MNGCSAQTICHDLKKAALVLDEICLYSSAKWARELLIDIQKHFERVGRAFTVEVVLPEDDFDVDFLLGREYFASNEFDRASESFKKSNSIYATFLHYYSEYLSIEKNAAAKCLPPTKALHKDPSTLAVLEVEVYHALKEDQKNPFLLYLHGLILIDRGRLADARNHLHLSLTYFPVHWGAWLAFGETLQLHDEDHRQPLTEPDHWMQQFFTVYANNLMYNTTEALAGLDEIERELPNTKFFTGLRASILNNARKYDEAKELLQSLRDKDQHRLEGLDTLSNILYAMDNAKNTIGELATRAAETNSMSPITCCIIGNYYASAKEHAKAIEYYDQALRIDRYYSAAWTLMGHELLEQQNIEQAAHAYNQAVKQNPLDFKAWYGLGQTHEQSNLPNFALHYFAKAATLKKEDDRFWTALGICYAGPGIKKYDLAIECFEKAVELGDLDGSATKGLAEVYHIRGNTDKATDCYKLYIQKVMLDPKKDVDSFHIALVYIIEFLIEQRALTEVDVYMNQLRTLSDVYEGEVQRLQSRIEEQRNES